MAFILFTGRVAAQGSWDWLPRLTNLVFALYSKTFLRYRELAANITHLRRITAGSSSSVTLMVTTMLSMAPNGSVAVTTTV